MRGNLAAPHDSIDRPNLHKTASRSPVTAAWYLPVFAFVALALIEHVAPRRLPAGSRADHLLNLAGLVVQGIAVPAAGYLLVISVMAPRWPEYAAILPLGWWGAFMLNFVVVDLLLLRRAPALPPLRRPVGAASVPSRLAAANSLGDRAQLTADQCAVRLFPNQPAARLSLRPSGRFLCCRRSDRRTRPLAPLASARSAGFPAGSAVYSSRHCIITCTIVPKDWRRTSAPT